MPDKIKKDGGTIKSSKKVGSHFSFIYMDTLTSQSVKFHPETVFWFIKPTKMVFVFFFYLILNIIFFEFNA